MRNLKAIIILIINVCFFLIPGCETRQRTSASPLNELDSISFANLSTKSYQYLNEQQAICDSIYKIGKYEHWFYDQFTGKLTFNDFGVNKIEIDFEEVGSLSFISNTWLWAWANPHVEEKVKSKINMVRDFGIKRSFQKLKTEKWKADEYDGWEMTAIAAYLMKAKGAYRVPSSDSSLYSFMIFKTIRWLDTSKLKLSNTR
jgi:hypothetical protein